jgi:glucose/arabinose dehydrogenase
MSRLVTALTWVGAVWLAGCSGARGTAQPPPADPQPTAAAIGPNAAIAAATRPPELAAPPTAMALPPTATAAAPARFDPAQVELALEPIAVGLASPIQATHAGDGGGRLFVVEKAGTVRVVADGRVAAEPFLDLRDRVGSRGSEQGLLGLAFHPQFATNGRLFVNYTDRNGDTVVSELNSGLQERIRGSAAHGAAVDPASERRILALDQPAANHNGGNLVFGPDGFLYIGTGDGGGANDRFGNGQDPTSLLGKMLRLDVDGATPYGIPPDNPFVGDAAFREEIWAYGLRNPWRYSFDRLTGDLWIADVGQNAWEEVNVQPAGSRGGENYGWPTLEGSHCLRGRGGCDEDGVTVPPVAEYSHADGCSISGGFVYRGTRAPGLQGVYLFGDYCSGTIWGSFPAEPSGWQTAKLLDTDLAISSFGEDQAGEVVVVDMDGGAIYRIGLTQPD